MRHSNLWQLSKEKKDEYIRYVTVSNDLSSGASRVARLFVDYPMGSNVSNSVVLATLGIKKTTYYRYLKELRDKRLIEYERKRRK